MHPPSRTIAGVFLVAVTTTTVAGCFADPTEVIVVVDTDAKVGRDFTQVQLCFSSNQQSVAEGDSWPVTVGVRKQGPATSFDVLVKLATTRDSLCFTSPMGQQPPPFASRKASDVHFVDGEMRVLFLPIFRSCACVDASGMPSTSCSHALDPDCHDFTNPSLGEFDEDNLPHLPASAKSP